MVCFTSSLVAHSPDLSSLIIYEQNGKFFIAIKSSLTAFEEEVIYHYGKDSYKTPQEFNALAVKYFTKSCVVVINDDTIRFTHPQIQLGHETTLFATLGNMPPKIITYYVKSVLFGDMPNNQCELILNHKDLPKKQVILNNENKHEVRFRVENNQWKVEENSESIVEKNTLIFAGGILLVIFLAIAFAQRKKKSIGK